MKVVDYAYRLLNVFVVEGDRLSGNPLCVFEDGRGLDDKTMQALALQLNLSETTFILPAETSGTARVRIFTPTFEMPFAGHPTLGTAEVVRSLKATGGRVQLEMKAGLIEVVASDENTWTLQARPPRYRAVAASDAQLAEMLGIGAAEVLPGASFVDTGSDQLLIPLRSPQAVDACAPVGELLRRYGAVSEQRYLAYVFAEMGGERIRARFFFPRGSSVVEDPATGSACANLGGWFLGRGAPLPLARTVEQGAQTGRPSRLRLKVNEAGQILVSGEVVELGRGTLRL